MSKTFFKGSFTWVPAVLAALLAVPGVALASTGGEQLDLTTHWAGFTALGIFVVAYGFVMAEEVTHLRKSKPVMLGAGLIWLLIGAVYATHDMPHAAEQAARHNILEYAELLLFLLVAMTYINAMAERRVFDALRSWLIRKRFGYRKLFWLTGVLSFFISPVADNLTTALLMCAVVMAVGGKSPKFVALGCINIVVAANAGGAFSPFGDITTLMVWQKGIVSFWEFFRLFVPSVVNFLVPAAIMHFWVPNLAPEGSDERVDIKRGGKRIVFAFGMTIATAVVFHNFFHLPPVLGMMTGLSYLALIGYCLSRCRLATTMYPEGSSMGDIMAFDVFRHVSRAEWDTLLFFFGVVMCVGGLGFMGYLALTSHFMYFELGPTTANVLVGILSAIVDNIPIMFAVLTMKPDMSMGQWLLVTLTAGVGGSMLSIGSAAGVALMGQARGVYTFMTHLKWTPVIALGYAASIYVHLLVNAAQF